MSCDKKYTPGPWKVTADNGGLWVDGENSPVAMIIGDTGGATELEFWDANLIAAAPELFEALEGVISDIGKSLTQERFEQCEKAIAKAKPKEKPNGRTTTL